MKSIFKFLGRAFVLLCIVALLLTLADTDDMADYRAIPTQKAKVVGITPHPEDNKDILIKAQLIRSGKIVQIKVWNEKVKSDYVSKLKIADIVELHSPYEGLTNRYRFPIQLDITQQRAKAAKKFSTGALFGLILLSFFLFRRKKQN
jgi:hypothetical protein